MLASKKSQLFSRVYVNKFINKWISPLFFLLQICQYYTLVTCFLKVSLKAFFSLKFEESTYTDFSCSKRRGY